MIDVPHWFFLFALAGFGLLFGSFANVVIWRFPRGESLTSPPSHCPNCSAPIAWYDNVPVVSWFVLRGRCRSCGARISARYPLVEVSSGLLWVLAGLVFGMTGSAGFAVVLFYVLLILTFIDIDHKRLPNVLVGALGVVGLIGVIISQFTRVPLVPLVGIAGSGLFSQPWLVAASGLVLGGGVSLLITALYGMLRGKAGLGMGDVKLLGVLGLFLGPYVLMVLMVGSILGAVYGLCTSRRGGDLRSARIPFGPFLAAGAVLTAAVGPGLWTAYARLVGLV